MRKFKVGPNRCKVRTGTASLATFSKKTAAPPVRNGHLFTLGLRMDGLLRRRIVGIGVSAALVTFCSLPAPAETIDRLVVEGSGYTRESAIGYTGEIAVTKAIQRYVRPAALESHREQIKYRILDESSGYINSF